MRKWTVSKIQSHNKLFDTRYKNVVFQIVPSKVKSYNQEQQNIMIEFAMLVTMVITIISLKVLNQGTQI